MENLIKQTEELLEKSQTTMYELGIKQGKNNMASAILSFLKGKNEVDVMDLIKVIKSQFDK